MWNIRAQRHCAFSASWFFTASTPMVLLISGFFLNGDALNSGKDCIGDITVGPNGVMVMNKASLYKLHMTKFHHSVSPQLSQLVRFRYGFMSFGQVVHDLIVFFCLIQISTLLYKRMPSFVTE